MVLSVESVGRIRRASEMRGLVVKNRAFVYRPRRRSIKVGHPRRRLVKMLFAEFHGSLSAEFRALVINIELLSSFVPGTQKKVFSCRD